MSFYYITCQEKGHQESVKRGSQNNLFVDVVEIFYFP